MSAKKPAALGCGCLTMILLGVLCLGVFSRRDKPTQLSANPETTTPSVPQPTQPDERERVKKNLDRFSTRIKAVNQESGRQVVLRVSAQGDTATITVESAWHVVDYPTRLRIAQALQKQWALITSPDSLDKARIKIVDANNNEVGGSRVLGGSLVWVQEQ